MGIGTFGASRVARILRSKGIEYVELQDGAVFRVKAFPVWCQIAGIHVGDIVRYAPRPCNEYTVKIMPYSVEPGEVLGKK